MAPALNGLSTVSFLKLYREYCSEFTDSPGIFHHRIGLVILSTIIGRNVYLPQGYKKVFPNIWLVVLAPSSFYRKSYSVGIAEDILRAVGNETEKNYILPREFSREKFVEILSKNPQGLLISYEFRTLMGMMSKDYMAGTQAMLTELFDCPALYDRKIKTENLEIKDPFLNMLSATTIEWLESSIKDVDLASGFLARFLVVSHGGKKENIMPWQKAHDIGKRDALIQKLVLISQLEGEIKISEEAREHYQNWYVKFESAWSKPCPLSPFYARLQEYAKKLAIIIAIDETRQLKIHLAHMKTACNLADEFANDIRSLVDENLNGMDKSQVKVMNTLKSAGDDGISRESLIRTTRLLVDKQLEPILKSFEQGKQIKIIDETTIGENDRKYVKRMYFWVNHKN